MTFAFRARSTGAKVSGRKRKPTNVQEPAKIIMTQKTQRQPRELVVMLQDKTMDVNNSPGSDGVETHKLPTTGPSTGPRKTADANTLVAMPRFTGSQISAMTPVLFVRGATAKKPQKKRVTSKVVMLFARAWPMWKRVYMAKVPMKMGRRPMSSEPGPQKVGPSMKPIRKRESMRSPTSLEAWKWRAMMGTADEGAEEANVLVGE
jgi:hypothetical protein